MSLSKEDRFTALGEALTLMLDRLGDKGLDAEIFYITQGPFNRIPNTTWRELEEYALIERCDTIGHPQCQFTGMGWYTALVVTDRISDAEFMARLSKLTAKLKAAVKGRNQDAYLYTDQAASSCGLSEDFVFNAIESRIIDHHFKIQGPAWHQRGKMIRIPLEFGLRPLHEL